MIVTFKSNIDKINKDLEKQEKLSREQAGKYSSGKIKEEVLRKFGQGDLYKGSGALQKLRYKTRVGFKKPAYHAHLVEYGTDERFINNYRGKKGVKVSSGKMPKNPFFDELLEREADNTSRIMSQVFVKGFN